MRLCGFAAFRLNLEDDGEMQDKNCPCANDAFKGNFAAMMLHNLPADGKPKPRAATLIAPMQPLKNHEDTLTVFFRNANPVIFNANLYRLVKFLCRQMYHGRHTITVIFERIGN